MKGYAFFDFDNTLSKGDSILSFLPFCIRNHYASPFHLIRTGFAWIRKWITGTKDYIPVKETTFSFLKGKSQEEIDEICLSFIDEVLSKRIYPDGKKEIEQLREEGYRIILVSASSDMYMKHITRLLPVETVLATRCEFHDGCYTGKMDINCKGEEKVRRIEEALGGLPEAADCAAYGDSKSDLPMLKLAERKNLINCRKKELLLALPDAEIKYWKVSKTK